MPNPSTRLFVCQKCNQQLGIDESLQDINSAAFDLLLGRPAVSLRELVTREILGTTAALTLVFT
jgi:hypothetical protein